MSALRRAARLLAALSVIVALTSCGSWRGIANVPLPSGPGTGPGSYTVYVQVEDALALNVNSRVRVADVYVGTVRSLDLVDWVGPLTISLDPAVRLPRNATAKLGQTSLLGTQHVELAAPAEPAPEPLRDGDTIPLRHTSAFPTTERTLAGIATVLRGRSEEHTSELQSRENLVCRLLLEKKNITTPPRQHRSAPAVRPHRAGPLLRGNIGHARHGLQAYPRPPRSRGPAL